MKKIQSLSAWNEELRQSFEGLFRTLNHAGPIPHAQRIIGMTSVILLDLKRILLSFGTLYGDRDWNTKETILELQQLVTNEFLLLKSIPQKFLDSWREILKAFNKYQE